MPLKSFIRAIMLLPFIVPTVLSAIAFWWIYDPQFSIISWVADQARADRQVHRFSRRALECALVGDRRQRLARHPVRRDSLLAGLQTISPSLYEAATLDGATPWQRFRHVTLPLLTPIIAVVMTFSVLFTFTDFQLIYVITRGGPMNATHLMATLSFQRAIPGGATRRGRGDRDGDDAVPDRGDPVQLLRTAAPRNGSRAATMSDGAKPEATAPPPTISSGMEYL